MKTLFYHFGILKYSISLWLLVWSVYEQVLIAALDFGKTDLASVS
jgi:hypothetical protein